jgi:S-adenosylmethionine hydrolase
MMKAAESVSRIATAICVWLVLAGVSFAAEPAKHLLVFMTDFGHEDDSVAICKGVMVSVDPELRIIDLLHDVTPFSVSDGARFLAGTVPYYPPGTVFVVVIDPGVGSKRKAIVAKSKAGHIFVLPDNGLLTLVQDRDVITEAREITNPKWMMGAGISSTFHGRDIFSPVAAHLTGGGNWSDVGPALNPADLVRLKIKQPQVGSDGLTGEVVALDGPYGNLVTNITRSDFEKLGYSLGDMVSAKVGDRTVHIPFMKTFSDVAVGDPLFYIDSRGRLSLAINQGNFAGKFNIKPPVPLIVDKKPAEPRQQ